MGFDPLVHVGVGVKVINPNNSKVLVILRKGAHGAGQWGLPGGWIDHGETPEKAALRELAEEVGMIGINPMLIDAVSSTFPSPIDTCITLIYKVPYTEYTMNAPRLEADKVEAVVWRSYDDLLHMELFPPLKAHLEGRFGRF